MRSGITRRWLRGNLLITVLLVLLAEAMFLYSYTRSYYNSVQQTMYRRFSSVTGQLKVYTADMVYSAAANRSMALRRMVEQYSDKDKYEFMLLDSYGGVIASSSGSDADGIVNNLDFVQAQDAADGLGMAVYRTESGEVVMAACYLVPYAAEDVAALRLVTSLTLIERQIQNAFFASLVVVAAILIFSIMSGLYFVRSIVVPLGQGGHDAAAHGLEHLVAPRKLHHLQHRHRLLRERRVEYAELIQLPRQLILRRGRIRTLLLRVHRHVERRRTVQRRAVRVHADGP